MKLGEGSGDCEYEMLGSWLEMTVSVCMYENSAKLTGSGELSTACRSWCWRSFWYSSRLISWKSELCGKKFTRENQLYKILFDCSSFFEIIANFNSVISTRTTIRGKKKKTK